MTQGGGILFFGFFVVCEDLPGSLEAFAFECPSLQNQVCPGQLKGDGLGPENNAYILSLQTNSSPLKIDHPKSFEVLC